MARKKKQAEPVAPTFEDVREDLAQFIESTVEFADAVTEDIQNITDTINSHAKTGNEMSDRVDQLTVRAEANRVLLQGCREDLKRERQAGAFGREELLTKIEDAKLDCDVLRHQLRSARGWIEQLEDRIYALEKPPTLWQRFREWASL